MSSEEPVNTTIVEEPIVTESTVEEPVAEPIATESTVEEPIAITESTVTEPIAEEPIAEESNITESTVEESAAEPIATEPIVTESIVTESTVGEPITESTTTESTVGEPIAESTATESIVEEPVVESTTTESTIGEPIIESITTESIVEESTGPNCACDSALCGTGTCGCCTEATCGNPDCTCDPCECPSGTCACGAITPEICLDEATNRLKAAVADIESDLNAVRLARIQLENIAKTGVDVSAAFEPLNNQENEITAFMNDAKHRFLQIMHECEAFSQKITSC